ncbi:hypothetical protein BGZ60DRAFT_427702 [Tricladium varicosporioides]|nr:hypothetical protein BGZ60DRAFT_427702 [Hymenoscyphus varicosporioides]
MSFWQTAVDLGAKTSTFVKNVSSNVEDDTAISKALIKHYDTGDGKTKDIPERLKPLLPALTQLKSRQDSNTSTMATNGQNPAQNQYMSSEPARPVANGRPTAGIRTQSADRPRNDNYPFGSSKSSEPPPAKGARLKLDRGQMRPNSARSVSGQNTAPPTAQSNYGPSRGGRRGNYEDSFAPDGAYDGYSSGSSKNDKPVMSANAPWSSAQDEFSGYDAGYGTGQSGGGRPAPGSRGPGLPSGPRGKRF